MENKTILSICITVYNQYELVKKVLEEILTYRGQDIEVVIGDDCSTDDIIGLVTDFNDSRIKYYRNKKNLGHDLNILATLQRSKSEYAMLLRTRDLVFGKRIKEVVEKLKSHENAAYFLFSALDDNKIKVFELSYHVYKKGREALEAHNKLYIHPSGAIYNLKYLDFTKYEKYITKYFGHKLGFVVHQLIRMDLASKGDFVTFDCFAWQYTKTQNAKDIAVNSSSDYSCVYAPLYQYQRYNCEINFIMSELSGELREYELKKVIERYYKTCTYDFYYINKDKISQRHYNFRQVKFSKKIEGKIFRKKTEEIFNKWDNIDKEKLKTLFIFLDLKKFFIWPFKRGIYLFFSDTRFWSKMVKIKNKN